MDFKKFLQIAIKDVRSLYTDRATLMITLAAPLAITIIMGFAFGNMGSGGSAIKNIPVVVVNQDKGNTFGNFGNYLADFFVKPPEGLKDLISAELMTDEAAARDRVRSGKAAAAVLIPVDFSQTLDPSNGKFGDKKITIRLYRDAGSPIQADIINGVLRQILSGFANADIAIFAAGKVNPALFLQSATIAEDVAQKSATGLIKVEAAETPSSSSGQSFNLLGYFAPAMAVFFLNFSMAFGAASLIEEQDGGTLQRLLTTPTSRLTILAGKLVGTYLNGVLQLLILAAATTIIAPILGSTSSVWGSNIPGLVIMILAVVAGSCGFGTLIAAISKTRQQVGVYGTGIMMLMGVLGGAFFASDGPGPFGVLRQLTVNWWATNGFYTLTRTGDLASVLPNIAVLLVIFVVCFGSGAMIFSRRLDV